MEAIRDYIGYLVWFALLSTIALECVRRFRFPVLFFISGLIALTGSFWFLVPPPSSWVRAGEQFYVFQKTWYDFRVVGFAAFLLFFTCRGAYYLFRRFARRTPDAA